MMDGVPIRKLLVRNFANRTTSKDIRNYFSKYGNVEKCYLRGNRGKSNCAFVTFTNVADAVRAMQDGSRKRIHNRGLRVMAAAFRLQPGDMEQRLYNMGKESSKESNKTSERKIANEQYSHKYLQNDTESVSIRILNDDCLKHIFMFLPIVDRVRIERVCKRWRDLIQDSWHMVKTLDISASTWFFRHAYKIHTDLLHKILLKCNRFLTHINIPHRSYNLCPSTLSIIGELCPNLTSIDVTGLRVGSFGIRTLANNCRNITKFHLGSSLLSGSDLKYFFKLNQKLEYLAIYGNNISGESLLCLPEQTMHTIILDRCNNLRDNHLSMALKRLKNLKHLTINVCSGITERTLEVIGQHCQNLRALDLKSYPPIWTDMSYLFHLVDLQILKIMDNPKVSDGFLADLVKHCQQLTDLNIGGCYKVSDAGLAAVGRLVRLEKLNVSRINGITDDGLKNICGLKELECQGYCFTDRGMSTFIKSSPQLQLLNLLSCWRIMDTTLEVAKHACSNRTNNVMLKIIIAGTPLKYIGQESLPPLLHIVKSRGKF